MTYIYNILLKILQLASIVHVDRRQKHQISSFGKTIEW